MEWPMAMPCIADTLNWSYIVLVWHFLRMTLVMTIPQQIQYVTGCFQGVGPKLYLLTLLYAKAHESYSRYDQVCPVYTHHVADRVLLEYDALFGSLNGRFRDGLFCCLTLQSRCNRNFPSDMAVVMFSLITHTSMKPRPGGHCSDCMQPMLII